MSHITNGSAKIIKYTILSLPKHQREGEREFPPKIVYFIIFALEFALNLYVYVLRLIDSSNTHTIMRSQVR